MKFALSVIQYPSGRWGFVGNVPRVLAYGPGDPDILDVIASCGPGLARKIAENRGVVMPKALAWNTREEAVAFAAEHGYEMPST